MVYGRYNYSIHGVYKPTNITGGHHPVGKPIVQRYTLLSSNAVGKSPHVLDDLPTIFPPFIGDVPLPG
jgi:hypothetical protein